MMPTRAVLIAMAIVLRERIGPVGQHRSGREWSAIESHVEHVRQPRQWMPVTGIGAGQGEVDPLTCQAHWHIRVVVDVRAVVANDEVVVPGLSVDQTHGRDQGQADRQRSAQVRSVITSADHADVITEREPLHRSFLS